MKVLSHCRINRRATLAGLAAALSLATAEQAGAQFWSRSEPKRPVPPQYQAPAQPVQVTAVQTPQYRDSGMRIEPARPDQELYKRVETYRQHLGGILQKLDDLNSSVSTNDLGEVTGEACEAIKSGKTVLEAILKDRAAVEKEGQAVLDFNAGIQQKFVDLVKEIDQKIDELRKKPLDDPQSVENLVNGLQALKESAIRGKDRSEPLKLAVLDSGRSMRSIYIEMENWPAVYDIAGRLCDTYKGLATQKEYIAMISSLSHTRQQLAQIIKKVGTLLENIANAPDGTEARTTFNQ